MNERQEQELIAKAQLGADVKDFVKHSGFAVLKKFIEEKVADSRNAWLKAPSAQAAEEIRLQAKPYSEIEEFLKRLIIEGAVAESNLHESRKQEEI